MFARGQHVVLFGPVEMRGHGGLQLTNPQYEILDDEEGETIHTGRIVPVYEKAGSVTPKIQRQARATTRCSGCRADLPDHAAGSASRCGSACRRGRAALLAAHFPPADAPLDALNRFATPAQRRLIFEEAFLFQLGRAGAAPRRRGRAQAGADSRRRSHPRVGAARCCRSS